MEQIFRQVLEKYPNEVKLVIKHFPLRSHKFARKAAAAALAANEQGKFWEFHHQLLKNHKTLKDSKVQDIAKKLDLDMGKFNKDMKSPVIAKLINRDLQNGRQAGVGGTPTVFVNGKISKSRDLAGFSAMIEAELKKKDQ
jgi:protein-disulfide isomerase